MRHAWSTGSDVTSRQGEPVDELRACDSGELVRELRGEFCICILSTIEPKALGSGEEANKSKGGFDSLDCRLGCADWTGGAPTDVLSYELKLANESQLKASVE